MKAKKVSFKQLKWYFSFGSEPVTTAPSQQLGKDRKVNKMRGNVSEKQFEDCREASRKIFYGKVNLNDLLKVKDVSKDQILTTQEVIQVLEETKVANLQDSDVKELVDYCDQNGRGFVSIPGFV